MEESSLSNGTGGESMSPNIMDKNSDNPSVDVNNTVKRKKESESLQESNDSSTAVKKTPRGRGRGRRKPEIEVYVPRALRVAKPDLKSMTDKSNDSLREKDVDRDEKEEEKQVFENAVSNESVQIDFREKHEDVHQECDSSKQISSAHPEILGGSPSVSDCNSSNSNDVQNESLLLCASSKCNDPEPYKTDPINVDTTEQGGIDLTPSTCTSLEHNDPEPYKTDPINVDTTEQGGIDVTPSTFAYHDPAVVAFLSSPNEAKDSELKFSSQKESNSSIHQDGELSQPEGNCDIEQKQQCSIPILDSSEILETNNRNNSSSPCIQEEGKQGVEASGDYSDSNSKANTDYPLNLNERKLDSHHLSCTDVSDVKGKDKEKMYETAKDLSKAESAPKVAKESCMDQDDNEGEEDSWDALFDDNGDCLDDSAIEEISDFVGKVQIDKPKINYLNYTPKEADPDMRAFGHIVEIYDFSSELATHDLIAAFRDFSSRGFDIKWVDDTHALGVFSSSIAAKEALTIKHLMFKVRTMSEASKKGQGKAKNCSEFLQPYKARPQTTSIAARRLVAGALGMTPQVSREVRDQERKKLKEAKEKRRRDRQQKTDMWDGSVGGCAMDSDNKS